MNIGLRNLLGGDLFERRGDRIFQSIAWRAYRHNKEPFAQQDFDGFALGPSNLQLLAHRLQICQSTNLADEVL